jgi:hypothetical protein
MDSPIYINLSGDYVIPRDCRPTESGSVNGDLRLASLDAFLTSLHDAYTGGSRTQFTEALGLVISKCNDRKSDIGDLILKITSSVSPKTNEMTFTFTLSNQ